MKTKDIVAVALCVAFSVRAAGAVDLSVPALSVETRGYGEESGTFGLLSRVRADFALSGGPKFSAALKFGLDTLVAEQAIALDDAYDPDPATNLFLMADSGTDLRLRLAYASAREAFGLPLELGWFVGHMDSVGTGADFPLRFGTRPFATEYRGFAAFPAGIGGNPRYAYDGLHEIAGTGLKAEAALGAWIVDTWLYQDNRAGFGVYSADFRALARLEPLSLELHAGATSPHSDFGLYRASLLAHVETFSAGGLLLEVGLPAFDPAAADPLGGERFFFLFEAALKTEPVGFVLTFFKRPDWYLNAWTGEGGMVDCQADLRVGDEYAPFGRAGLKVSGGFDFNATSDPFTLRVVPYYKSIRDGIAWECSLGVRFMPDEPTALQAFEPSVSATASF